jgi:SAM-dependent methyltransferase
MGFQDHFSELSAGYARYRPGYPPALFEHLRQAAPGGGRAWDAAAGSGQAADALAALFRLVVASDAAVAQLLQAPAGGRVAYLAATCEGAPIAGSSIDLVTVAQALHWLDLERFWPEVRRVLRPGGVVAAWAYALFRVDPEVDAVVQQFYSRVVGPYWPPERRLLERGYRDLPFPFRPVALPRFEMSAHWDREAALGYVGTWSAVGRYRRARREDPLQLLRPELEAVWPPEELRLVRWPLSILAGRHEGPGTIEA